jgi:hypothetical protein
VQLLAKAIRAHLFWKKLLALYLAYILALYLIYLTLYLTIYLAYLLAFYLAYLLVIVVGVGYAGQKEKLEKRINPGQVAKIFQ